MEKILELINSKLAEHQLEINKAGDFKEELKKKIIEGREALAGKQSLKAGQTAMEILTLNDKISFHLACIKCLTELKKDIFNVP